MHARDIASRIAAIAKEADDIERAHLLTDELYIEVLRHIASAKCGDCSELAGQALAAESVLMGKWYA